MVSTSPMTLYSPPPFGISTIVVHIKASGMYPFQNAIFVTLTTLSHVSMSRSFSLVSAGNHALRCSTFIPNGPPALPERSLLTAAKISPTSGGPSAILTGCTRIGMSYPFGGRFMLRSSRIILLYWGFSFLRQISIFQWFPITFSQSSWSFHIHHQPQLHIVSGLSQQFCGGLSGVVSMPQLLHHYLLHLLILQWLLLPELLILNFHYVLLLVWLLMNGLLLLHLRSVPWLCIES